MSNCYAMSSLLLTRKKLHNRILVKGITLRCHPRIVLPLSYRNNLPKMRAKIHKIIVHQISQLVINITILTYGVKTFTHRGGLSDLLYWKQNAIDSSSLSQREMVFHCNSTVCASRAPSSRHACNRKLFIPTAGTTWPSLRLSHAQ